MNTTPPGVTHAVPEAMGPVPAPRKKGFEERAREKMAKGERCRRLGIRCMPDRADIKCWDCLFPEGPERKGN